MTSYVMRQIRKDYSAPRGFRSSLRNRPRSIYQYSNMAPRLSGQNSIFGVVFFVFKSLLGIERQKKLEKFAILTRKPRSHARILIYRTWPILSVAKRISKARDYFMVYTLFYMFTHRTFIKYFMNLFLESQYTYNKHNTAWKCVFGCLPFVRINRLGRALNNGKGFSKISKPTERNCAYHLHFDFP